MKCISKSILVVFFLLSLNVVAQETFPKSWEGNYKGELQIFGVDSIHMKLEMKLNILQKSDSIYQWKIIYNFKGKEDIRDYELLLVDKTKGIYKIDEKNTIIIDSYYKTEIFTSFFEVMDSFIISTYTKENKDIIFEIIASDGKTPTITGNSKFKDEDIPEVKSYLVNSRQKAILKKQ
ncbi:hypothetical protein [Lutibacter sp.]|uniref:hypothetical protein n=1 Tax=Lutibacter sp. TaxID=1925666 RepID=UPI00356B206D